MSFFSGIEYLTNSIFLKYPVFENHVRNEF